jgi:uncharacterized protein (DUF1697 family)
VLYTAFLRAINVGTTNRIRMEVLRRVCDEAGFGGVGTYLQTGNLVFEAEGPEVAVVERLEAALAAHGLKNANAMVRTTGELASLVGACPAERYDLAAFRCYVTFFGRPLGAAVAGEAAKLEGVVAVRERELLTVSEIATAVPGRDINGIVAKLAKQPGTTRYWSVAAGLLELARTREGQAAV